MAPKKKIDLPTKEGAELWSTTPVDSQEVTHLANTVDSMMNSIGASGTKIFGGKIYEEYNPKLQGLKGLETFEEMRRSDAQINACLLAIELPIRSTLWYIEPGSTMNSEGEAETSDADKEIKEFVEKCIFDTMETTFDDFLRQSLTMCTFGFSIFEKIWKRDGDKIVLKDLAQRLARTVESWNRDKDTGKYGILQQILMNDEGKPFNVTIPPEKLLIFSFRREGANMEWVSVLRSAYKHWYIKDTLYKLDAVKHERQSVGIPIITLPSTHADDDGDKAEEILENIRSTEKSYIVLPSPDWKFEFAQMGSGTALDTSNSIEHHNREIVKNILAGFLDLGSKSSSGGSYALSEDQSSLFLLSLSALAQQIADTINNEIIRDLVDLNFTLTENQQYPKLRFQKLGEVKYEELAGSLSTLTGAGLITPDTGTEEYVRKIFDLPKKEMDEEGDAEDMDEDEEAGDLESEADDEAIQEEADSDNSADDELTKLEEEMSKLEASEIEGVYEASLSYSDEDVASLIFKMSPDEQTREKIRQGLISYWDKKGRKAKPTLSDRKDSFDKRSKDASGKIKDAVDKYKASIDPLKKQIETLTSQKKAGKLSKKQASAQIKQIKAQIKAIRDGKDEYVQTLKYIKRDAIQGKKQVKETIAKRKKAISAVIKQITEEVKSKNATRSEAIKSLALQIKASVQNYQKLKEQAKSKEEKTGLKSLYAQIKSENDTLRATAKTIREQAKSDRATAKAKKEEIKKTVQYSEQFGEEGYGGCVMLNVDWSKDLAEFQIDSDDLLDPSKSVDPYHVTLLYGLSDALKLEEITAKIKYNGQSPKVKKMKIFENEDFDVLVLEIEKEEWISSINRFLRELDYKNEYPQYVPHVTLAYCKKWQAKKYVSDLFNGSTLKPLDIVHTSNEDDTPTTLVSESQRQMSEEDLLAHNFSDRDEMTAFLQARKFFDPQVLIRVQNYGA